MTTVDEQENELVGGMIDKIIDHCGNDTDKFCNIGAHLIASLASTIIGSCDNVQGKLNQDQYKRCVPLIDEFAECAKRGLPIEDGSLDLTIQYNPQISQENLNVALHAHMEAFKMILAHARGNTHVMMNAVSLVSAAAGMTVAGGERPKEDQIAQKPLEESDRPQIVRAMAAMHNSAMAIAMQFDDPNSKLEFEPIKGSTLQ